MTVRWPDDRRQVDLAITALDRRVLQRLKNFAQRHTQARDSFVAVRLSARDDPIGDDRARYADCIIRRDIGLETIGGHAIHRYLQLAERRIYTGEI
jgi:hypothetical protein